MCDWPVWDGYYRDRPPRDCGNNAYHRAGSLAVCGMHFEKLVDVVFFEMSESDHFRMRVQRELEYLSRKRRAEEAPPEADSPRQASWVYFAERDGFVKIGTSTDVRKRMTALASGGNFVEGMTVGPLTLLAVIPGNRTNEQFFHRKFAHLRLDPKREWFLYDEEIRNFVEGLKGAVPA